MPYPFPSPRDRFHFWWLGVKQFFQSKSVLSNLMLVNIAVWVLMLAVKILVLVGSSLMGNPIHLQAFYYDVFAFHTDYYLALSRPWTIITSLFVHAGFWHLFFNMLMLYVLGKFFLQYKSGKQLLATYLIGGVAGNLLYLLAYHVFPVFAGVVSQSCCVGASGAVMAIMFAVTVYRPHHPINLWFLGRLELKWVALVFVVIDLLGVAGGNAGGHFSHLGGAIYGTLVALWYLYAGKIFNRKPKRKKPKFYYSNTSSRPVSDADFNAQKKRDEERVDAILDKISKDGYGALTTEERDFLYHYKR
ncbi:MAG: rhomboid family intramembrane serine protease [Bacteroidales bacterium]|nr:rhomboid family intramembrane serine protease [Bacteroidales bacterium]